MCELCWRPILGPSNVHRACIVELSDATQADRAWVTESGLIYGRHGLLASPHTGKPWENMAASYHRDLEVYA